MLKRPSALLTAALSVAVPVILAAPVAAVSPAGGTVQRDKASPDATGPRGLGAVDIVAERVFLRTGFASGPEVDQPAIGQAVVFHGDWRVDGTGGVLTVPMRALLDGEQFCVTSALVGAGDLLTTFCDSAWTVTAGSHTVRWEFDFTDAVAETNELNNSVSRTWQIGVPPTSTRSPTRTRTPSRTPTGGSTSTPTSTRVIVAAESFHGRGDADCNLARSAADVVATLRALNGESRCGNDDCTRDAVLSNDDVTCAATCLFGQCAVPPNAPVVTAVEAESAAGVVPGSLVTIRGSQLGSAHTIHRVTVGGREAAVIGYDGQSLLVVMPFVEPGTADLVVFAGEIGGLAVPVVVEPATAIGGPDSLADLLALHEEIVGEILALDLGAIYGDEAGSILAEAVTNLSEAARAIDLASDPDLTAEILTAIDASIDASGLPDSMREVLLELRGLGSLQAQPRGGVPVEPAKTVIDKAVTIISGSGRGTATVIQAAAPPAAGSALASTLGAVVRWASTAAGVVAVVTTVVTTVIDRSTPILIPPLIFSDADGAPSEFPTAGGFVDVKGRNLDTTSVRLRMTAGSDRLWERAPRVSPTGDVRYLLPDASGFCGTVRFQLQRGADINALIFPDTGVPHQVRPVIHSLAPTETQYATPLALIVGGALPCESAHLLYEGPSESPNPKVRASDAALPFPRSFDEIRTLVYGRAANGAAAELPPGHHVVRLEVEGLRSQEPAIINFRSQISALDLDCDPGLIYLPPSEPSTASCSVSPVGATVFPLDTTLTWQVAPRDRFRESPDTSRIEGEPVLIERLVAGGPGTSVITVAADAGEVFLADSGPRPELILVEDDTAPVIGDRGDVFPFCGTSIAPGPPIAIVLFVSDNHRIESGRFVAQTESRVLFDGSPAEACDDGVCTLVFDIPENLAGETLTMTFEATDPSGNHTRRVCAFSIRESPSPTPFPTQRPISVDIERIAERGEEAPAAGGTFFNFFDYNIDRGVVVFLANLDGVPGNGVYLHDGSVRLLEQGSFSDLSISGGFTGFASVRGLYHRRDEEPSGMLEDFVQLRTDTFGSFRGTHYDSGRLAFNISRAPSGLETIYVARGPVIPEDTSNLALVVDTGFQVPGQGGTFFSLAANRHELAFDAEAGDRVAFIGRQTSTALVGVYTGSPGESPIRVADNTMGFTRPCAVAIEDRRVAFVADEGVFLWDPEATPDLVALVDTDTPIPDGGGRTFTHFACRVAMDGGVVAFRGETDGPGGTLRGVYVYVDGQVFKTLTIGQMFEGATVGTMLLEDDQSISVRTDGSRLVDVVFGNSSVVYRATIGPIAP